MSRKSLQPEHILHLQEIAGAESVTQDVCMKPYTSMRVGGNVSVFIEVKNSSVLQELLQYLFINQLAYAFFGNGSNLLVSDEGYQGVLLHISSGFSDMKVFKKNIEDQGKFLADNKIENAKRIESLDWLHSTDKFNISSKLFCSQNNEMFYESGILAGAGVLLSTLSKFALENTLTGLEFASGIPGSLGGALAMNAGAYDGEMSYVVKTTRCMDIRGNWVILHNEEHEFGYRSSKIGNEGLIAVESILELLNGNKADILDKMKDFTKRRQDKQPLNYPSAGSAFKRPVGYYSGKLIEDCGLKGMQVGGAMVSEKHAGFIVNVEDATATDVIELIQRIRDKVFLETGVKLEPEVKLLKGESLCNF